MNNIFITAEKNILNQKNWWTEMYLYIQHNWKKLVCLGKVKFEKQQTKEQDEWNWKRAQ